MLAGLRIGLGHDTHRLVSGGPLRLGGLDIQHDRRTDGHSDADVLLHALIDALLGAAALGDIGDMFPDTDPAFRDADSTLLLGQAYVRVRQAGFQFVNADCIVFAQRPRLGPLKAQIRDHLALLLDTQPERINVKAKTGERVGPVGHEEAIQAECIVLLQAAAES